MSSDVVRDTATGRKRWAIAEGYLADPQSPVTDEQAHPKHETLFLLNAGDEAAKVALSVYFADHEPIGPFVYTVGPGRTVHVSLEELDAPRIPRGKHFATLIESDKAIVVLATRRRRSEADGAPLSKIAFGGN